MLCRTSVSWRPESGSPGGELGGRPRPREGGDFKARGHFESNGLQNVTLCSTSRPGRSTSRRRVNHSLVQTRSSKYNYFAAPHFVVYWAFTDLGRCPTFACAPGPPVGAVLTVRSRIEVRAVLHSAARCLSLGPPATNKKILEDEWPSRHYRVLFANHGRSTTQLGTVAWVRQPARWLSSE